MIFSESYESESNRKHARVDRESYSFISILDLGAGALRQRGSHVVREVLRAVRIVRGVWLYHFVVDVEL